MFAQALLKMPDKVQQAQQSPIEVLASFADHPVKVVLAGMFCGCIIEAVAFLADASLKVLQSYNEKKNA